MARDRTSYGKENALARQSAGDYIFHTINMIVWVVVLFVILYPMYLILISSFSDPKAVVNGEVYWWPVDPSLVGYEGIFKFALFWRSYLNSFIYTISGTALGVFITLMGAYALSNQFLGKRIAVVVIIIPMFFSGGLIPSFLLMNRIGLYDNPLIIVLMSCMTVWNLMLARTYISNSIPRELYEAASIDGASHVYYFFHVVLPLSGTITAVLCIYYGVNYWNDWYNALIYLRNKNYYPMPFVLREILAKLQIDTPMYSDIFTIEDLRTLQEKKRVAEVVKYCAIILSTGPAVILYLFMQKFFVKGVMIGSLKG